MTSKQTMMRILAAIAALAVVSAAVYGGLNWRYWRNYFAQNDDPDRVAYADKYRPRQAVTAPEVREFPVARHDERTVSSSALDDAAAYTDATNSMAFIVLHRGVIQRESYAKGFGPESLFDSYSMHKGLLSLAFGIAVDHGLVKSLDLPASTFLPEWRGDNRKDITVRHLLAMTSGLFYPAFAHEPFNPVFDFFVGTDLRTLTFSVPLARKPGEVFDFNHINSQALAFILETASGMSYADFLTQYLWTPMGGQTAYVALDRPGGAPRTVCCFISTARNWVRIGELMRNKGKVGDLQVVSETWIAAMTTPDPTRNVHFGYAVWTGSPFTGTRLGRAESNSGPKVSQPYDAPDLYFIEGHGGQRVYVVPSRELVVFRTGRITDDWDDHAFMNKILKGTPALPTIANVLEN